MSKAKKKITQESKSILYFFIKTKSKKKIFIYCPTKSIDKNRNKKATRANFKTKESINISLKMCVGFKFKLFIHLARRTYGK